MHSAGVLPDSQADKIRSTKLDSINTVISIDICIVKKKKKKERKKLFSMRESRVIYTIIWNIILTKEYIVESIKYKHNAKKSQHTHTSHVYDAPLL